MAGGSTRSSVPLLKNKRSGAGRDESADSSEVISEERCEEIMHTGTLQGLYRDFTGLYRDLTALQDYTAGLYRTQPYIYDSIWLFLVQSYILILLYRYSYTQG